MPRSDLVKERYLPHHAQGHKLPLVFKDWRSV